MKTYATGCEVILNHGRSISTKLKPLNHSSICLTLCGSIEDLGQRDTFPFEERTFLRIAIKALTRNDTDTTRNVLSGHKNSVWLAKGESHAQWELVKAALNLLKRVTTMNVSCQSIVELKMNC